MQAVDVLYKSPEGAREVMALYDAVLARWPVPYETRCVSARHGDAYVIVCGPEQGPPLLLLHGAGTNSAMWLGDVAAYCQHFRVFAVDLLGEAGRSAPNRPDWEGPAYAEWLADVLDGLGLDRVAITGISQGSWTALKFAVSAPDRVDRLALMSPGGIIPDRMSFVFRVVVLTLLGSWGLRRIARMLYGSYPVPEGVEAVTALMMKHFRARIEVLPLFSDEELRQLTMPVLLIGGTEDALRDMDGIADRMRTLLPDVSVAMVEGGGHALVETTGIILPFLLNGAV